MSRIVGVTGASSQLGVFLLPRLQSAGFRVHAFSRRVSGESIEVSPQVSWRSAEAGADGLNYLVSCGPLALAASLVAGSRSLERLVAFSTSSVSTKANSTNHVESEHMASIQADEKRLKTACSDRGVGLLLLRPTLIYGCGLDQNISMLARFGRRFGFIPMAGNARGLRQPVHADDLAAVVVNALSAEEMPALETPACGGSTLSYRDMVTLIAACLERVRPLAIPPWMLATAVSLTARLPAYQGVNSEMVKRQGRDMVFDDSALRKTLCYDPRIFSPGPADFEIPVAAGMLQLPR
jgi:nucleoside-diphosphate-sugar epimerase